MKHSNQSKGNNGSGNHSSHGGKGAGKVPLMSDFPGGNKPSKTGGISGGGRGNALPKNAR